MKKKYLSGITFLAIAAGAAFNLNLNDSKSNDLSDISLANVEALANGEDEEEGGEGYSCTASANCFSGDLVIGWVKYS